MTNLLRIPVLREADLSIPRYYEQKELNYGTKQNRIISYLISPTGENRSDWKDIATIEERHYLTSF
nr:hypothetical protein [Cytophagales bacterium]